jgi:hypothetical protein
MAIESTNFSICSSRPAGKESCDSREIAMRRLDENIKRARAAEGSAGMLHNGVWELHFPNKAMILYWVEDSNGDIQQFP